MILWHLYASVNIIYFILNSQKAQINYKRDTGIIGDKYEGFIPELHRLFIIICVVLVMGSTFSYDFGLWPFKIISLSDSSVYIFIN